MKKRFNNILFFIFLLASTGLHAQQQDITGVWKGLLYVDSTKVYLPYEIAISEEKNKMTGYSRIIFYEDGKAESGYEELAIKWKGDQVIVEDEGFFEHNFTMKVVKKIKKTLVLSLIVSDTQMILKGNWSTNRTRYYLPATGTVELKRKIDYKATALFQHLDTIKLADKLVFTYKENKPAPTIAVIEPIKKTIEPIVEIAAPILPAIPRVQGITMMPIIKKRQTVVVKIIPPANDKKTLYSSLTKMAIKYTPVIPADPDGQNASTFIAAVNPPKPVQAKVVPAPVIQKPATVVAKSTPVPEKKIVVQPSPKTEPVAVKQIPAVEKSITIQPTIKSEPIAIVVPSELKGAADLDKRTTVTDQFYYFDTDSLVLTLYDNGYVDGDVVTVLMNGNIIFSKQLLTTQANTKIIHISNEMDSVNLVMYAENLGEIPPNTGLMVVLDGEKRYDVRFTADLKTNASIVFRRKK